MEVETCIGILEVVVICSGKAPLAGSEPVEVEICICILEVVVICSGKAPLGVAVSAPKEAEAGTCSGMEEKQVGGIPWGKVEEMSIGSLQWFLMGSLERLTSPRECLL